MAAIQSVNAKHRDVVRSPLLLLWAVDDLDFMVYKTRA
jgi:hypothetical protein